MPLSYSLVSPAKSTFLIIIFLAFGPFADHSAQQTENEEITVDASIVVLNAVVTDRTGDVVKDLAASDFLLYEDGARQTIEFVEPVTTPFAAVILLDISGSMEQRVSLARSAAIRFLYGLRGNDQVSIFSFNRKIELIQDFSNSRDLKSRVFDLEAGGATALNDAIYKAATVLKERKENRRAIIVLSDGADNTSGRSASKALKEAQSANATIYTVDMSPIRSTQSSRRQNIAVLKNFAKKTGGLFVSTPGGIELRNAFASIVQELGVQFTIGYQSTNQLEDGKWREIDLKGASENLTIRTREGYFARKQ